MLFPMGCPALQISPAHNLLQQKAQQNLLKGDMAQAQAEDQLGKEMLGTPNPHKKEER